MKFKTQAVLGLLFLASFIKSFLFSPSIYDSVFIILITIVYLSKDYFTEKSSKIDLEKLTADMNTRLNVQDEELERIRNNTSKMALTSGFRK